MAVAQQWQDFLREQYPQGSRIRLRTAADKNYPVQAGSEGTLRGIDDEGRFHVEWDSGQSTDLMFARDSFTVFPPELETQSRNAEATGGKNAHRTRTSAR